MAKIIEVTPGNYTVETEVVTPYSHQLHVKGSYVGVWNIGSENYVNRQMEMFSEWIDPTGTPYASLSDLIEDLNNFFFDLELPYPEVDTRNDLPVIAGVPPVGTIYVVRFPVTETIAFIPYRTHQSGQYIRDTSNGNLGDWRRLNIKTQFRTSELEVHDSADTSKVFGFVANLLTSGVKRLLTIQDKDQTLANLDDIWEAAIQSSLGLINQTVAYEPFFLREVIPNVTAGVWSLTLPETGDYVVDVFVRFSLNSTGDNFLTQLVVDGTPQEPHRLEIEPKDSSGGGITLPTVTGGVVGPTTNTGTSQRLMKHSKFFMTGLSGTIDLTLEFAADSTNEEAAIYDASIFVRRLLNRNS